ncbi:MAG: bifunctional 3-(3-hydroxy-phenyl)propionate/3-hydroxycinnamic acid hydroxylase [Geminicoccaceae bacterium]
MSASAGMRFVDPNGRLLLDWPRPEGIGPHGWHTSYRFHQPDLERVLRARLHERPSVEVRASTEAVGIDAGAGGVRLTLADRTRRPEYDVEAAFVVGCDGARSFVRREIGGGFEDHGFDERWLVVDLILHGEKPELGDHSIQHCDPRRPVTYVRGPGRRRRFEITLLDGESDAEMTRPESVWPCLGRWLQPHEAVIERAAVYTFHALLAGQWRRDRLLIAGDAAHQTPPFMGQGMCTGIRDAANLAWKLALVVRGESDAGLLDSYQGERLAHARSYIETAVRLGRLINAADSRSALEAAMPAGGGGATMRSIRPSLGPGPGSGRLRGTLFDQPLLADGRRLDDAVNYAPVLLTGPRSFHRLDPPAGVDLFRGGEGSDIARALEEAGTDAVLLRPDRYVHASIDIGDENAAGLHWPP